MTTSPIFNVVQLSDWAEVIASEIEKAKELDPVWHWANNWKVDDKGSRTTDPTNNTKGVFDDVKLHFVNRNFNILYLESTIHMALTSDYEWSPLFTKSRELFEHARQFNNETGPFGRMIVWDVPPGAKILAHVDDLPYQKGVVRYIYTASKQSSPDISINIKNYEVPLESGMMFAFHAEDVHEFTNNSNEHWYFLGIDYWIPEELERLAKEYNITKDSVIQYDDGTGIKYPKCKYWTRH